MTTIKNDVTSYITHVIFSIEIPLNLNSIHSQQNYIAFLHYFLYTVIILLISF